MDKEVKIVRIEAIEGAVINGNSKDGQGYGVLVNYCLEDGTKISAHMTARLKGKLKEKLAALPREVDNMTALFDDGKFWGTRTFGGVVDGKKQGSFL